MKQPHFGLAGLADHLPNLNFAAEVLGPIQVALLAAATVAMQEEDLPRVAATGVAPAPSQRAEDHLGKRQEDTGRMPVLHKEAALHMEAASNPPAGVALSGTSSLPAAVGEQLDLSGRLVVIYWQPIKATIVLLAQNALFRTYYTG